MSYKYLTTSNPKMLKGETLGYMSFVYHLAPTRLSGFEVCPRRSAGCTAACLNLAGRGRMIRAQTARIRKTVEYFVDRDAFMAGLVKDVETGMRRSAQRGLVPVFRFNGTSDIRWELVKVNRGPHVFQNIMLAFPTIQFYDYTKIANRRNLPPNYHLTFSYSGDNQKATEEALARKMNVAVVFAVKKGYKLPATFWGRPVIDGDEHDLRFMDPKRVIVGLRAKGPAKKSTSTFIVIP